ncbi:MAG: ABC transporter permease subunit [Deltaproteobacteria bacterium]|nr:ABC transporter permease subunit [Deltaproteobacteria bacterium]
MTVVLCLCVSIFLTYLLIKGLPSLGIELIFGQTDPLMALLGRDRVFDGIFPAMVGTFCLVVFSALLALPMGVCSGIYLAEYAKPGMKKILGGLFDILAGIPSIVIGLFGFSLAIFLHRHFSDRIGPCLFISAGSLAVLVLPYIVRSTQTSLEELPADIRKTALALGATKLQNIEYVLVPNALSGISSGVFLAIGRCAEDTAVILLTGAVATAGVPSSLLAQYEALPFYIFYISNQYSNPAELSNGYGACLVLLGICAVLFMFAYGMKKHLFYRTLYRA